MCSDSGCVVGRLDVAPAGYAVCNHSGWLSSAAAMCTSTSSAFGDGHERCIPCLTWHHACTPPTPFASSGSACRGLQGARIDGVCLPYGMRRQLIVLQGGGLPQGMRGRRTKQIQNWKALFSVLAALVACGPGPCSGPPLGWPMAGGPVAGNGLLWRRLGLPGLGRELRSSRPPRCVEARAPAGGHGGVATGVSGIIFDGMTAWGCLGGTPSRAPRAGRLVAASSGP
eukprot:9785476-Alexandrium_andersonii.AAC.1